MGCSHWELVKFMVWRFKVVVDADGGGDELNFLREMGLLVASILKNQLGLSAAKEASQMETGKLLPGSQRVDMLNNYLFHSKLKQKEPLFSWLDIAWKSVQMDTPQKSCNVNITTPIIQK